MSFGCNCCCQFRDVPPAEAIVSNPGTQRLHGAVCEGVTLGEILSNRIVQNVTRTNRTKPGIADVARDDSWKMSLKHPVPNATIARAPCGIEA